MITRTLLRITFCFLALAGGRLPAAELASDFPKTPIPLELAPRMGRPFQDHAVFQQNMPIPVWGWTLPGAEVAVSLDTHQRSAKAGPDGRFHVTFEPMPADKLKSVEDHPAGHTLTVVTRAGEATETKSFSNILIGEVWLCSGQSNMAVKYGSRGLSLDPNRPALRFLDDSWNPGSRETCGRCYAISFVFAHKLLDELLVPVGVMNAAVAGTGIEGWWHVAPGDPPTPAWPSPSISARKRSTRSTNTMSACASRHGRCTTITVRRKSFRAVRSTSPIPSRATPSA